MTALILAGAGLSLLIGLALCALWIERYVRNYGEIGGPPWERNPAAWYRQWRTH